MLAGDVLASGQRDKEILVAQQNPHAGESARLAAMAQEAETALSALQADPSVFLAFSLVV